MSRLRWRNYRRWSQGEWKMTQVDHIYLFWSLSLRDKRCFVFKTVDLWTTEPRQSTSRTLVESVRTSTSWDLQSWESCWWQISCSSLLVALYSNLILLCSVALCCRISTSSTRTSRLDVVTKTLKGCFHRTLTSSLFPSLMSSCWSKYGHRSNDSFKKSDTLYRFDSITACTCVSQCFRRFCHYFWFWEPWKSKCVCHPRDSYDFGDTLSSSF